MQINKTADLAILLYDRYAKARSEYMRAVFLDEERNVICKRILGHGDKGTVNFYPSQAVAAAVKAKAAYAVLSHNHPSGIMAPSDLDIKLTRTMDSEFARVGVELYDHIIMMPYGGWFSFKSEGIMPKRVKLRKKGAK